MLLTIKLFSILAECLQGLIFVEKSGVLSCVAQVKIYNLFVIMDFSCAFFVNNCFEYCR